MISNANYYAPPPISGYKYSSKELTLEFNWKYTLIGAAEGKASRNGYKWMFGATTWIDLLFDIDDGFRENYTLIKGRPPGKNWFKPVQALYIGPVVGARYLFKNGIFIEIRGSLAVDIVPFIRPSDSLHIDFF